MSNTAHNPIVLGDLEAIVSAPLPWERLSGKTVLVTGASGFLPAYMVETLLFLNTKEDLGCKVIGLVRDPDKARRRFSQYRNRDDFVLVCGDVSVGVECPQRCDFIIHAASQASPKYYDTDPVGTMTANVLGTYHLLNLARRWNSEGFLFFSSGEVYGQVSFGETPTKEDSYGYIDISKPRACYAEGKRAAETLGFSYAHQFKVPFKVVRPFHTYGPGMALDDGRVFADFVRDVVLRRDLLLRSDGKAIRSFCYLSDAVTGFFTVLLKGDNATSYNVGNPLGAISIGDLADILSKLYPQYNLKVRRTSELGAGYLPSPISINIPNVDRLLSLGWTSHYLPREGFLRTVSYFNAL